MSVRVRWHITILKLFCTSQTWYMNNSSLCYPFFLQSLSSFKTLKIFRTPLCTALCMNMWQKPGIYHSSVQLNKSKQIWQQPNSIYQKIFTGMLQSWNCVFLLLEWVATTHADLKPEETCMDFVERIGWLSSFNSTHYRDAENGQSRYADFDR